MAALAWASSGDKVRGFVVGSMSVMPNSSFCKFFQELFSLKSQGYLWLRVRVDFFFKSDHQSVQSLKILEL
jgi:hypothetical protein